MRFRRSIQNGGGAISAGLRMILILCFLPFVLQAQTELANIPVGGNATAIASSLETNKIYVADFDANLVTVLDAANATVVNASRSSRAL